MSQAFEYALHSSHTADFERNKSKSHISVTPDGRKKPIAEEQAFVVL
jgi:hypothetical protein